MPVPKAVKKEEDRRKAEGLSYVPPRNCGDPVPGAPLPNEGDDNLYVLKVRNAKRKVISHNPDGITGPVLSTTATGPSGRKYWLALPEETPRLRKDDEITVEGQPAGSFSFGEEPFYKLKGVNKQPLLLKKISSPYGDYDVNDLQEYYDLVRQGIPHEHVIAKQKVLHNIAPTTKNDSMWYDTDMWYNSSKPQVSVKDTDVKEESGEWSDEELDHMLEGELDKLVEAYGYKAILRVLSKII